jgi:hypothetical protein
MQATRERERNIAPIHFDLLSITPRLPFTPVERTHWIGDWVSFRACLVTEARAIILCLY